MAVPFEAVARGLESIKIFISNILNKLIEILDYLNPFSDNFFLKIAFIPGHNQQMYSLQGTQLTYFESYTLEIKQAFDEKFGFVNEFKNAIEDVKNINSVNTIQGRNSIQSVTPPKFTITMPQKYGGQTYEIVNFEYFSEYRIYILNFVRFIAYFFFIKKMFKAIPKIIY